MRLKCIKLFCFFFVHSTIVLAKPFLSVRPVCPAYSFPVKTNIKPMDFQSNSGLFTTENFLPFTDVVTVDLEFAIFISLVYSLLPKNLTIQNLFFLHTR